MLPSPLKKHFILKLKKNILFIRFTAWIFESCSFHDYLLAIQKKSFVLISYPSRQDGPIFPTGDCLLWVTKVKFVWECMILINFQVNRSCWFSISQKLTDGSFYQLRFCSPPVCPVTGTLNLISSMSLVFRSNCDPVIRQELRTHYQLPYFLPKQSETSEQDWIFMGGPGPGAQIHVSLFSSLVTCICSNLQLWLCFLLKNKLYDDFYTHCQCLYIICKKFKF